MHDRMERVVLKKLLSLMHTHNTKLSINFEWVSYGLEKAHHVRLSLLSHICFFNYTTTATTALALASSSYTIMYIFIRLQFYNKHKIITIEIDKFDDGSIRFSLSTFYVGIFGKFYNAIDIIFEDSSQ